MKSLLNNLQLKSFVVKRFISLFKNRANSIDFVPFKAHIHNKYKTYL